MWERAESAGTLQSNTEQHWWSPQWRTRVGKAEREQTLLLSLHVLADEAGWTQNWSSLQDMIQWDWKKPLGFVISAWTAMRYFFFPYIFYNKLFKPLGMWQRHKIASVEINIFCLGTFSTRKCWCRVSKPGNSRIALVRLQKWHAIIKTIRKTLKLLHLQGIHRDLTIATASSRFLRGSSMSQTESSQDKDICMRGQPFCGAKCTQVTDSMLEMSKKVF